MKRLGKLIANWRWAEKLTAREAAAMIGLSPSTYSRLERGYSVDGNTLAQVLMWLLQPAAVEAWERQVPPIVRAEPEPVKSLDVDAEAVAEEVHAE